MYVYRVKVGSIGGQEALFQLERAHGELTEGRKEGREKREGRKDEKKE
jgi:hypothetical protein